MASCSFGVAGFLVWDEEARSIRAIEAQGIETRLKIFEMGFWVGVAIISFIKKGTKPKLVP